MNTVHPAWLGLHPLTVCIFANLKKNTHKKIYSPAAPDAGSSGVGNGSCAHSVHFIINIVASWGFNAVCCFFFFRRFVSSEKCPTDRGKESTRARMYVRREHEQGSWNSRTEPALSASVSRSCYREPCQRAVCKSAAVCCGIVVSVRVCLCVLLRKSLRRKLGQ